MRYSAWSNKSIITVDDSSSDSSSDILSYDTGSVPEFCQIKKKNQIIKIHQSQEKESIQTGVNIPNLLKFIQKNSKGLYIDPKIVSLVANAVIVRMLPPLKAAIDNSRMRNRPISNNEDIYISSIPTLPFVMITAENYALAQREKKKAVMKCEQNDEENKFNEFVEHISETDVYPLHKPKEIVSYPKDIEKIMPTGTRKNEVTITDFLLALKQDKRTDLHKLKPTFATAYLSRRKKKRK